MARCSVFVNGSVFPLVSDADYASVELYKGYPEGWLEFASVCCGISMIIGIPGNLLTMVALANYKKVRNATAIFIIYMSCTDLLLLCLGPPVTISNLLNRSWIHGKFFCQLYPLAKITLFSASIYTTVAITINRYILIIHPRIYCKIYRNRNLVIMLVAILITPLLAFIPTYFGKWGRFDLDSEKGTCVIVPDQNKRSPTRCFLIFVLVLPSILIIYCYARIFVTVRKALKKSKNTEAKKTNSSCTEETTAGDSSSIGIKLTAAVNENYEMDKLDTPSSYLKSERSKTASILVTSDGTSDDNDKKISLLAKPPKFRRSNILQRSLIFLKFSLPRRKDKRLGTMILAIMTSFFICYLPLVLIEILHAINYHPKLTIAIVVLPYFSCCFNPVIYVAMSNEYQKAYKYLFRKCCNL